jgi:tetratricopeptide (TPR) repeat protein
MKSLSDQNSIQAENEQVKAKILALLEEAETQKAQNLTQAIKLLEEAKQEMTHLKNEVDKMSVRNATQNKGALELLYLSKHGNILYEIEEYQLALASYDKIQKILPSEIKVYKAQGDCYRKMGNYEEALKKYQTALLKWENDDSAVDNDKAAILNSKALVEMNMDDHLAEALKTFQEIIKLSPSNPLYHCNMGKILYAQGKQDQAMKEFSKAHDLIKSGAMGDELNKNNLEYLQNTFSQFLDNVNKINNITFAKPDPLFEKRKAQYIDKSIANLEKPTTSVNDDGKKVEDIANKKKIIENIDKLYEYKTGFVSNLSSAYLTAKAVSQGTFTLDTGNTIFDGAASLIKLVPLCGDKVAEAVTKIKEFVITAQIKKAANNVCKFSDTVTNFELAVEEVVIESILARQKELEAIEPEKYILKTWSDKFVSLVKKTKEKIETKLYGELNETPMMKLGYKDSCNVIEKIASGQIYGDQLAIRIKEAEKIAKLTKVALDIIDQEIADCNKPYVAPAEVIEQSSSFDACCQVFAVSNIKYDNPLLNNSALLQKLSKEIGFNNALALSNSLVQQGEAELLQKVASTDDTDFAIDVLLGGLVGVDAANYS